MARVINQNKEVIKRSDSDKKATVSMTSLVVGIALSIVAVAIIVVIILFLTSKPKDNKDDNTTPLIQYIENYNGKTKTENKIKLLKGFDAKYELEKFTGECYILVYDTSWMSSDKNSNTYKAYEIVDSYLTGSKRSDGKELKSDPLLTAIDDCGQDVKFFVVDFESVKKKDEDLQKDPIYFTMKNGTQIGNINAPMFFHYKETEEYDNMYDKDLLLADGSVDSDGKAKYRASDWGAIIINQVNYINGLTSKENEE